MERKSIKIGILGGGPSAASTVGDLAECDKIIAMNQSIKLYPMADAWCFGDPLFIQSNEDLIRRYDDAINGKEIIQGIVTNHPDGYASKPHSLANVLYHYGFEDFLYHGRTVGVLAIRVAIERYGATELLITGIDGYDDDSPLAQKYGQAWCKAINTSAAKAIALIKLMHPSVTFTWCKGAGAIMKPLIEQWESAYRLAVRE